MTSFEPGEDWFYDTASGQFFDGPQLLSPGPDLWNSRYPPLRIESRRTGNVISTADSGTGHAPERRFARMRATVPVRATSIRMVP